MGATPLRAYLVDDEPLAIERLQRMLANFSTVRVVGSATDPVVALTYLKDETRQAEECVDVLFLDIQMPGLTGFDLLAQLSIQPFVIFTTAFDEFALKAFEVNSIDYLLKPIRSKQLERAIAKLGRIHPATQAQWQHNPDLPALLQKIADRLPDGHPEYPRRIASRVGERILFLDLDSVTHFVTEDKLTWAVVDGRMHSVDQTVAHLEARLNPMQFLRIHRSSLVNMDWIQEVNRGFRGEVIVTLRDSRHTQLTVARDRVGTLKTCQGIL